MTKSDRIDIAVLLVVPVILSRRSVADIRRRITWLVLAGTVCVAIMAPWSIYLSTRFRPPGVRDRKPLVRHGRGELEARRRTTANDLGGTSWAAIIPVVEVVR